MKRYNLYILILVTLFYSCGTMRYGNKILYNTPCLSKQKLKTMIDSLYLIHYKEKTNWIYESISYDDHFDLNQNVLTVRTSLKTSNHYGMEILLDTNCQILKTLYFIDGFDNQR